MPPTTKQNSDSGEYDYDFFVIGGGSGGVRAARIAAQHGAKTALAEVSRMGGTCVNVGCIPKKLFVYGSHYGMAIEEMKSYGWDVSVNLDWKRLIRNKDKEIERLNGIYMNMLKKAGVQVYQEKAKFTGKHELDVGGKKVTAKYICIATGSRTSIPSSIEGGDVAATSNDCFVLDHVPKKIVVCGAGYIAVEFACIFHGHGADVTLVHHGDKILRGFDEDVRDHLMEQMRDTGIDIQLNLQISKVEKNDDGKFITTCEGGKKFASDFCLLALGRQPNVEELGLEEIGVEQGKKGAVKVNEWMQSSVPHIYAVGDVTNKINLTPVALNEGFAVADTLFSGKKRKISLKNIGTAVFATPAMGTCGMTEAQAREEYGWDAIDVYKSSFRPLKHTLTHKKGEKSLMKLVVVRETDKVVGVHVVDHSGPELMQMASVALHAGATKAHFDQTIGIHPTSAEELVTLREPQPIPEKPKNEPKN